MRLSVNHVFERRVGLWPAGFDGEGNLFCNQRYGDWPMAVDRMRDDPWSDPEWFLLSYRKAVTSSAYVPGNGPENVVDEDIRTWWRSALPEPGAWLAVDLGETMTVCAVQVNFTDDPNAEIPCSGEAGQRAGYGAVHRPGNTAHEVAVAMTSRWMRPVCAHGLCV